MKLGINGWRLQTRTGVARVLLNVIKYWTREFVADRFQKITLYTPTLLSPELAIPDFVQRQIVGPNLSMLVWENLRFAMAADDDVLFCPSFSRPLFARGKTVTLVHEATQALYPQFYPVGARFIQTPLYGWSARNSTRVTTPTNQSRQDIIRAYQAPAEKVRVVPLAPAEIFKPLSHDPRVPEIRKRYTSGEEPFFLFVGKITPRRNVPSLIEAIAELKRRGLPHKLVIVGLNTANVEVAGMVDRLGLADRLHYREFVNDEDLALLYSAAEGFILPCSYEAVSLTVLEAQAAGTPVITSDTPGLREMTGEVALFLRDSSVASIAEAMSALANDAALRQSLTAKGLANAGHYSWRRTSTQTLDVLKEAASL
jgi:glycosyltransferase involved in cell wall biosynthesis